jgi:POT family proton-dependent oligopeptide transporter
MAIAVLLRGLKPAAHRRLFLGPLLALRAPIPKGFLRPRFRIIAMQQQSTVQRETLLGHPVGIYTLFFAEMWERFSYYGMRALLLFYMIKGFLKYGDSQAYTVYGAYTALVYMTPFFGGMIADRILGQRRAVVLGGLLMAAGHLMMTIENAIAFYSALGMLIVGNGFFKPNISTIVGKLYPAGSPRRDGGFTIFYMGVNLGAAIAPLLCGYIGETFGWHRGFGLATIGMLTGVAVFVAPSVVSQIMMAVVALIAAANIFVAPLYVTADSPMRDYLSLGVLACLIVAGTIALALMGRERTNDSELSRWLLRVVIMATALGAAFGLYRFGPENIYSQSISYFVALALVIAAVIAWIALGRGGLPAAAGAPRDEAALRRRLAGIPAEWLAYLGAVLSVPVLAMFVSGFAPLNQGRALTIVPSSFIESVKVQGPAGEVAAVFLEETSKPAGLILFLAGLGALAYVLLETVKLEQIARQRNYVILILMFFSMFFWACFEQAGSSVNNFTDRNVNRVIGYSRTIDADEVGSTITIQPTQEQLGYSNGGRVFTIDQLGALRESHADSPAFTIDWNVSPNNVGMRVAERDQEIPASWFQSINPVYILIFGLVFTALWGFLGKRGMEPSTPVKFALGLLQLGLGFGAFWYGAQSADDRGMVALAWLFLGYLLQTTGELCISPVGLSMVTKLSPTFLVSTMMGMWMLAMAFSQFLAAIIAQFTGVSHGADEPGAIPVPKETVDVYGDVFGKIAIAAMISAVICFALSPLLTKWMHREVEE